MVHYSFLHADNIPTEYRSGSKFLDGELYVHLVAKTLAMYFPITDSEIHIYCDQRKLKGFSKSEFVSSVKAHLLPLTQKNTQLYVEMVDSTSSINIQIADWIAGALAAYHNQKLWGSEYWQCFKSSIVSSKEFFKDYWLEKQKTQPES